VPDYVQVTQHTGRKPSEFAPNLALQLRMDPTRQLELLTRKVKLRHEEKIKAGVPSYASDLQWQSMSRGEIVESPMSKQICITSDGQFLV
jgi:hypothetical protein